ncbi:MAG: sigma-70 family RNA polymerase sigma factor [Caldilinea sp. CFX5]|nr:sigma-70 family RNA polymerase sigma factor [Caldilinea sp. CFX5]
MQEIETLVLAAQGSDGNLVTRQAAFSELVRRFQDMVYGYALATLGDHHLAQDVAQETFLTAYRHIEQVRQPLAFPGWLRRVVVTQCNRITRDNHLSTQPLESIGQLPSPEPSLATLVEGYELHDELWRAIETLSATQRLTTILVYIDGYSQQEVAAFLNVSVETVKKRLERARKQLRARIIEQMKQTLHQQRPSSNQTFVQKLQLATLLETAALEGQLATLELLLLDGLDVNAPGHKGQTLLHWAAQQGQYDVVELLLQHKADPTLKDRNGKTALQLAVEGNQHQIAELLRA